MFSIVQPQSLSCKDACSGFQESKGPSSWLIALGNPVPGCPSKQLIPFHAVP